MDLVSAHIVPSYCKQIIVRCANVFAKLLAFQMFKNVQIWKCEARKYIPGIVGAVKLNQRCRL